MSEEVTACHEAGHMVAAWDLGLAVLGASIVPDEETAGRVICPVETRVRFAIWADEENYLYAHLVVRLAGIAAGEKYTGIPTPDEAVQLAIDSGGLGNDYNSAADFILELGGDSEEGQAEIGDRALMHATNLIHARWECVEAVAVALLDREALDEAECRQVLGDAFRS